MVDDALILLGGALARGTGENTVAGGLLAGAGSWWRSQLENGNANRLVFYFALGRRIGAVRLGVRHSVPAGGLGITAMKGARELNEWIEQLSGENQYSPDWDAVLEDAASIKNDWLEALDGTLEQQVELLLGEAGLIAFNRQALRNELEEQIGGV